MRNASTSHTGRGGYRSGAFDGEIRLWDGTTGRFLKSLGNQGTIRGNAAICLRHCARRAMPKPSPRSSADTAITTRAAAINSCPPTCALAKATILPPPRSSAGPCSSPSRPAKGRRLLRVVTCRSGSAFNARRIKDANDGGVVAFSATNTQQDAVDLPSLGHGVFTAVRVRGLRGEADLAREQEVRMVRKRTNGR